ncbi:MAG: hypothetical protein UT37_C0027G0009 [Parcubacteria group bacterium GW2011_GWA2_39_18]|nr:MAG: hypothetical protein UT37_C0027G0009 [Parcubacteria group bacterium GW2011_GWA2_39_18]
MDFHFEILDESRKELLPVFANFKNRFYLAGGTALALQIGHRQSIDFDFFTETAFTPESLIGELKDIFPAKTFEIIDQQKNTLNIIFLGGEIKVSFLHYPYPLLNPPLDAQSMNLASKEDIAAMKCSAILSRSELKDYVDLYYLIKEISLERIMKCLTLKMPGLSHALVLKSLSYFNDVNEDKLLFMPGFEVSFSEVKKFLEKEVRNYVLAAIHST